MGIWFEENFKKCLENLNLVNYRAATADLYPISKRTASLGLARDGEVIEFARQITDVLELLAMNLMKVSDLSNVTEDVRFLVMDTCRILRNSCAANPKVQEELGGTQGHRVMQSIRVLVDTATRAFTGEALVQCLAVAIQVLTNLGSGMEQNQDLVWDSFKPFLTKWLNMAEEDLDNQERNIKILNVACALIEGCLPRQWQRTEKFLQNEKTREIMEATIQAANSFQFEFGKKVMVKLVQIPNLAQTLMGQLTHQERFLLYDSMKEVIGEWRKNDEKGSVPTIHSNLTYLASWWIQTRPDSMVSSFMAREPTQQLELHSITKVLEVLCDASACTKSFAPILTSIKLDCTEPRSVIMCAIDFLKEVHSKGQESWNELSIAKDSRLVQDSHPSYLLRRDLVRLIANLSFQNKEVQDTVREACNKSGIPLLCQQLVIDERNPYVAEWAKLALTNLIRDNGDNAKFMMSITPRGHPDAASILKDCGMVLERQGDKVTVRSEGLVPSLSKLSEKTPLRNVDFKKLHQSS